MPLVGRLVAGLVAGRAVPRARQLIQAARLAEVMRDLRDGLDDLDEKTGRLERLEQRISELEQRADRLLAPAKRRRSAASSSD